MRTACGIFPSREVPHAIVFAVCRDGVAGKRPRPQTADADPALSGKGRFHRGPFQEAPETPYGFRLKSRPLQGASASFRRAFARCFLTENSVVSHRFRRGWGKVPHFASESAALFTGASNALFSAVPNPSPARLAQGVPAFRRTYKYTTLYDVMFFGKSDIHPRKRGRKSLDFILRPPAMAYREPNIARSHSAPFHTEMSAFPPRVFRCLFHGDSGNETPLRRST